MLFYFFESKRYSHQLWVSLNGVNERCLLPDNLQYLRDFLYIGHQTPMLKVLGCWKNLMKPSVMIVYS